AALGDIRELDGLPGRRQHVGQVEEPVVRRALWDLDRAELSLWHAQVLGLAARDLAIELGVAEERRPGSGVSVLRRLALGEELLVAHPAVPAGDVERDDHSVALL